MLNILENESIYSFNSDFVRINMMTLIRQTKNLLNLLIRSLSFDAFSFSKIEVFLSDKEPKTVCLARVASTFDSTNDKNDKFVS